MLSQPIDQAAGTPSSSLLACGSPQPTCSALRSSLSQWCTGQTSAPPFAAGPWSLQQKHTVACLLLCCLAVDPAARALWPSSQAVETPVERSRPVDSVPAVNTPAWLQCKLFRSLLVALPATCVQPEQCTCLDTFPGGVPVPHSGIGSGAAAPAASLALSAGAAAGSTCSQGEEQQC